MDFLFGLADTGLVGHNLQFGLGLYPGNYLLGKASSRATGAVSDRHEIRAERFKAVNGPKNRVHSLGGFRGEELARNSPGRV